MKTNLLGLYLTIIAASTFSLRAQLYWDTDGATAGAGGATPAGTWNTTAANWSSDFSGSSATGLWTDGNAAAFAAGFDATGSYTVTVSGTQSPSQITFEEGTVTLSGGVLDFPLGGNFQVDATLATINSVISGGGAVLNQFGAGTLVLGGNNTFSNTYSLAQGTLRMGASGNILSAARLDVASFATLDLNDFSVAIGSLGGGSGNISATVNLGSGTLTNLGIGQNTRFDGAIIGSGGLTMTGTNTLTLIGTNASGLSTFTGKTTILGGALSIAGDASLGAPPGAYVANQVTIDGGTLNLLRTQVEIPANRGIYVGLAGGTLGVSSSQTPTINTDITGPGALVKSGSGNVNLNGNNTFAGGFTITGGGIRFNSDVAAGTGLITISPVSSIFLRNLTPPGNTSTITNAIMVNSGASFIDMNATLSDIFILSGPISGSGPMMRGQQAGSSGIVVLSGDNSGWNGGLTFQRGKLAAGHKNALGASPLAIVPASNTSAANTAVLMAWTPLTGVNAVTTPVNITITNASFHFSIGGVNALELAGAIDLGSAIAPIITVSNTGGTTISGSIGGGAGIGLTKEGAETLTLGGANSYSGTTTVNAGALLVNSPGSLAGGGVVVNSGGALGGSGTINGAVTINTGGSIAAGSSAGTLTLANGLNVSAGGTNVWELAANSAATPGTDFDQIVLTGGNLALDASSVLRIQFTGTANPVPSEPFWQANHSWKIINGANSGSTSFGSIEGTNGISAGTFAVTADTTGVFLNYTAASVPSAAMPARITSITGAGTTSVTVNYTNTLSGTNYVLSYSTNLATTNWFTSGTKTAAGTTDSQTDSPAPGSPRRYYRVYYVKP